MSKLADLVNIEAPTEKQKYVFKTMLGWAEKQGINVDTLHTDGTVVDTNGSEYDSPIDTIPIEAKEQLIVLAGPNGELDKIFFSEEGSADAINITKSLNSCEGIELTEKTPSFEDRIEEHLALHPKTESTQ